MIFFLSYKEKRTGLGLAKIWDKGKDNVGEILKLTYSPSNQHCDTSIRTYRPWGQITKLTHIQTDQLISIFYRDVKQFNKKITNSSEPGYSQAEKKRLQLKLQT